MVLLNSHTCDGGNRTLLWSQFCDGIIDCHDRSDEEGHFCKLCINNLYSCSSKDEIRCDLACKMLHYVPCQTIQDRRACNNIYKSYNNNSFFQLFEEFKIYIVITVVTLLVLISISIFIKYFIQQRKAKCVMKSTTFCNVSSKPIECDTLSSHIYEQCYESPNYETKQKYPWTKTYYEHVV
ncbi:unnamed protein product [Adineta steineri]|uniref:Uncharacterized protein n=1 Tax=Adineta steineri TaxID=433720 RepID=A0A815B5J1_9BILA|nr:unnamed protein product [Adineta steineri]CAF1551778.1 unnamed protein product [Adineta steineri]